MKISLAPIVIILSLVFLTSWTPKDDLDYEKEWKKVEELSKKGFTRSALNTVEYIYEDAKREKNHPQFIKALIWRLKIKADFEEMVEQQVIDEVKKEIESASEPLKQILHSVLAEIYQQYLDMNRYRIYERTQLASGPGEDIDTWTIKDLNNAISWNYTASLLKKNMLQNIPIEKFTAILTEGRDSRNLRPTLYDLLAFRALEFFKRSEAGITEPEYAFQINHQAYFRPAEFMIHMELYVKDTASHKYKAIEVYRDLLLFHLKDKDPSAFIDADLSRLEFVKEYAFNMPDRDSLYFRALNHLWKDYKEFPMGTEVAAKLARQHIEWGNTYNRLGSDLYKWDKKKALDICEEAIALFPHSRGAAECKNLIADILDSNVSLKTEEVVVAGKPFLGLLQYQNIDTLDIEIVKGDYRQNKKWDYKFRKDELLSVYKTLEVVHKEQLVVPNDGDYQTHAVQIPLPKLESGFYIILLNSKLLTVNLKSAAPSTRSGGSKPVTPSSGAAGVEEWSYKTIQVSDLGYLKTSNKKGETELYIVDRTDGKPLKGVRVDEFEIDRRSKDSDLVFKKREQHSSDANGYVNIPYRKNRRAMFRFTDGKDTVFVEGQYSYRESDNDQAYTRVFFFTDRQLYRPGQRVYFKGMVIESQRKEHNLKEGVKYMISLKDANYQSIDELSVVSNEYGSFNGSFLLPSDGLSGNFTIQTSGGYHNIQVEEYKRPKFEVKIEKPEASYTLDEVVKVTAKAETFAGSPVDGANVSYQVTRQIRYPWWWWRHYSDNAANIEKGNGTTNEEGKLEISFIAHADKSAKQEGQPWYDFQVEVTVSDINGETHTTTEHINIGYTALKLSLDIPQRLPNSNKGMFQISSTNMNNTPIESEGTVTIYKLKKKERFFRTMLWEEPDQFILTEDEHYRLFPRDQYKGVTGDQLSVTSDQLLTHNLQFNTQNSDKMELPGLADWEQGTYRIVMEAVDEFGNPVKFEREFQVFDPESKEIPVHAIHWSYDWKLNAQPGEEIKVDIGTADKNVHVLYEVKAEGRRLKAEGGREKAEGGRQKVEGFGNEVIGTTLRSWIKLNNSKKSFTEKVFESDRGGFLLNWIIVKDNRVYQKSEWVSVPYDNKKLDVRLETYRNKMLPGSKEEWRMIIQNKGQQAEIAEVLAGMYDASLDAILPDYMQDSWQLFPYSGNIIPNKWNNNRQFSSGWSRYFEYNSNYYVHIPFRTYDELNWFGYRLGRNYVYSRYDLKRSAVQPAMMGAMETEDEILEDMDIDESAEAITGGELAELQEGDGSLGAPPPPPAGEGLDSPGLATPRVRKNFNETAFFYPNLMTNKEGEVILSFEMPDALTRWKFQALAHTKDLKLGYLMKEVVTQKDLMVFPNAPRFFREGDTLEFSTKIQSLLEEDIEVVAKLELFDAGTMRPISDAILLRRDKMDQAVDLFGHSSTEVSWTLVIPNGLGPVTYRVSAMSEKFADAEENTVPVLSNRLWVTETMPLPVNGKGIWNFEFKELLEAKPVAGEKQVLTFEFTPNPIWYAIQALPYLMEYPHECAEQLFSRYYANSLATHIINQHPEIKRVFDHWAQFQPEALLSNLEKNQELKSAILNETPWVLNAQDETQRKRNIALLFEVNKMRNELRQAENKLRKMQMGSGGWPWFKGGKENRYITQHIVTGLVRLSKYVEIDERMLHKAIRYLDTEITEDFKRIKKYNEDYLKTDHLGYLQIQYLYARSKTLKDLPLIKDHKEAYNYFEDQAQKYWYNKNNYAQAMIALTLHELDKELRAEEIMASLKERALYNDEMGMYWRKSYGYYWYEAPIETQAMLIEAFTEITDDKESIQKMQNWLLKNKQTNEWGNTKATVEAVGALLLQGKSQMENVKGDIKYKIGNFEFPDSQTPKLPAEAGTGYIKMSWSDDEVTPEMGNITIEKETEGIAWGGVYYQHFADIDEVGSYATGLSIEKKHYRRDAISSHPEMTEIDANNPLNVGDKVVCRIVIKNDRDLEFVHLKDLRAAGFEPLEQISGYKWQDGIGYYQSNKDASMNFFIGYLPKGTFVLEYEMFATAAGNFSAGYATLQCMYAPEFSSRSEGERIVVEK